MKLKFEHVHLKWGITVLLVILFSITYFFMVYRMDGLLKYLGVVNKILTPFTYGLVMAYLLCPLYNLCMRVLQRVRWPRINKKDKSLTISKALSTTASLVVMFAIIGALLWMIIPQLIESIISIARQLPSVIEDFVAWLQHRFDNLPQLTGPMERWVSDTSEKFVRWVEGILVPQYDRLILGISGGLVGIVNVIKNFFIGVIICVFFINSKDIFEAQSKKLIFALLREERADAFLRGATFTNRTFGRFINGKLIDSLIVGIICFVVMSIFNWPYALLISVIIGITNIIPFFGPFIGAIPSALLLLMEDAWICFYFVIFILILQQIDGNILGPKILGDSTGLSSFWVMFAILVGGGLFGFVGMIIGIPLFAVFYAYLCYAVNKKLEKKGLSTDLREYQKLYRYGERAQENERQA
ncbi:MAG: AI-2E family transporter [Anaerovoracaceae bacterium]